MSQKNRGFTLIELMVVVAIIGILAAVAIPSYMFYVQKSRAISLVIPGLHIIESNLALYYATSNRFPADLSAMTGEADTRYFNASITGNTLKITINSPPSGELNRLNGYVLYATPSTNGSKITSWAFSGSLAYTLGI